METAETSVLAQLKQAIYAGELMPGEQLRQSELAERFGVSRVPLREALLVLANIGLAEHTLNSGFRVAKTTTEEYEQLHWLLGILEPEIHSDLRRPSEDELASLEDINAQISRLSGERDEEPFTTLNYRFHTVIWSLSRKKLLVRQLENVWPLTEPFIGSVYTNEQYLQRAVEEHATIIDAIRRGDTEDLLAAVNKHRLSSTFAAASLRPRF